MRYDFSLLQNKTNENTEYYENSFPIISRKLKEEKDNSLHFQSFSDPPVKKIFYRKS